MYCANCGSEVDENKNYCRICGAPVGAQSVTVPAQQIAVADTEPAGTTAAPVASKKKASVGSVITLIICVTLDAINFLVSGAFLCIAALVAVSRLYLFVHWPTDVIGGMITGVFSAKIGYKITNPFSGLFKKKKKKRR